MGFEAEEGIGDVAERITLYGAPGLGKTTFGASAPRPYIIDLERGATRLQYVGRPTKENPVDTWEKLLLKLDELYHWSDPKLPADQRVAYKTVVIDTLDRAEWYCWDHLCKKYSVASIELIGGGYGKGYTEAHAQMRGMYSRLDKLFEERGMHIITLAHEKIETVKNPSADDYTRYVLKCNEKVCGILYDQCDHLLHAYKDVIVTDKGFMTDRPRAMGGDRRLIHTVGGPTYLAKNRGNIPSPIPFTWHDFVCHNAVGGFPRLLRETIADNARRLNDSKTTAIVTSMLAEVSDVTKLAVMNTRLIKLLGGAPARAAQAEEDAKAADDAAQAVALAAAAAAAKTGTQIPVDHRQ